MRILFLCVVTLHYIRADVFQQLRHECYTLARVLREDVRECRRIRHAPFIEDPIVEYAASTLLASLRARVAKLRSGNSSDG